MSVWKRELFKWAHPSQTMKEVEDTPNIEPLVVLGRVDPNNADLKKLHFAALHGRRKDLLAVLQTGIWVDFPNDVGQTALFAATLRGQYRTVDFLLQNGANPNEKSDNGMTPVHVACLKASLRALGAMIQAGGDLRLHDNQGNGCLDWASYHPDPRKRMKMMEFLQKSQLFALNYSGDFVGGSKSLDRQPSILQMLRGKVGSQMSLDFGHEAGLCRSHGYGRVYYGAETASGVISVVPLVTENQLRSDSEGITFQSGSHFIMTSMLWNMTAVTIKRLDKKNLRDNTVDLLISEVEHISKLRHPNLLLLMGLCQSNSFDNLMLVFERISIGSLYFILHEKIDHFPMTYIRDIASQVCQAMLYIQSQNYIHCNLTSHAIFMVSMHQAKVGNLEYMLETRKASTGRTCIVATSPHMEHFYRWMAPEIMKGDPPCPASDFYSFCCILWEMITSEVPWKSKTAMEMLELHKSNSAQLHCPPKAVALFQEIVEQGLKPNPKSRPRDFSTLLRWLQGPLDKPPGWKPNSLDRVKTLQKESKERISVRSGIVNFFDVEGSSSTPTQTTSSLEYTTSTSSSMALTQAVTGTHSNEPVAESTISSSVLIAKEDMTDSRTDSDITNNHNRTVQQRAGSATDSWSTLDNSDDSFDLDAEDGGKNELKNTNGRYHGSRTSSHKADQTQMIQLPKSKELLSRNQFERSSSFSGVSRLQKYSRRTASLPWQGSLGLLRAGSTSPWPANTPHKSRGYEEYMDDALLEQSCKTFPPVKPASHSTDVKQFVRGDPWSMVNQQTMDVISRQLQKHSPRRSLTSSRNRTPRSAPKHVSATSPAAVGDGIETVGTDIELSMPGSVRTLTEQFQARLYNHNLRQSILKGSMTPHGTVFEDLDTSPTRLELSPDIKEIPPEGQKPTDPDAEDKDGQAGDMTGSTESLTSVSFRDESTQDEEDERGFPLSSRNELDITDEVIVSRPTPVYTPGSEQLQYNFKKSVAKSQSPNVFQENSAFRVITSEHSTDIFDQTDSCQDTHNRIENRLSFLPSSKPGTDISNHPFDFQDYYIDDDYTGMSEDDSKHAVPPDSHETRTTPVDGRPRVGSREHYWLGEEKKSEHHKKNKQQLVPEKTDKYKKETWRTLEQREAESCRKDNQNRKYSSAKWLVKHKKREPNSYRKEDQWLEDQWQKEEKFERDQQLDWTADLWEAANREEKGYNESNERQIKKEEYESQPRSGQGDSIDGELRELDYGLKTNDSLTFQTEQESQHDQHAGNFDDCNNDDGKDDDEEAVSGLPEGTSSKESSLSTVVARPVGDAWLQSADKNDDDDDNDKTLIAEDVTDQRRCILLNLERNTLSGEELSKSPREDSTEDTPPEVTKPRRSSPQSTLRKFYLGSSSSSQGYTTTLRVESSLENPGSHHITHTACDTTTGLTKTVHEETVQAGTLRTTMSIQ